MFRKREELELSSKDHSESKVWSHIKVTGNSRVTSRKLKAFLVMTEESEFSKMKQLLSKKDTGGAES